MLFEEKIKIPLRLWHLLRISQLDGSREYSFSDIERALGYNKPRIDIRETLGFLGEIGGISPIEGTFPKRYKIRGKPIRKWLRNNTDCFKWAGELIELTKSVYNY